MQYIWTKLLKYGMITPVGGIVVIYDGNVEDTTDFRSDKYLNINSCGFQNISDVSSEFVTVRKNGRKDYHILLVTNGTAAVLFNKKTYNLSAGNVVIYFPGEEQYYSLGQNSSTMWCHFSGYAIKDILDECNIKSGIFFYSPNNAFSETFMRLIRQYNYPLKRKYANVSLLELLYMFSDQSNGESNNKSMESLLPVLTYINANYNKNISIDILAKKAGYSKSRFSHLFADTIGITPKKYQNNIKLRSACEFLNSTTATVTEIALMCGFNDALYFSRIFKKKYGVSPSEYRKK